MYNSLTAGPNDTAFLDRMVRFCLRLYYLRSSRLPCLSASLYFLIQHQVSAFTSSGKKYVFKSETHGANIRVIPVRNCKPRNIAFICIEQSKHGMHPFEHFFSPKVTNGNIISFNQQRRLTPYRILSEFNV